MLEVTNLSARYGQAQVVREVTFVVAPGEAVALVGPNGAGKTTLLRAVGGLHQVRSGTVRLDGEDLSTASTVATARAGLVLVPQGRRLFASLTVAEHIRLAESRRSDRPGRLTRDDVFSFFPQLAKRLTVRASSLSGGEQQMLAITRAVLQGPRYILLDEPTEGLSPSMVDVVSGLVTELPARGMGLVITEQSAASHVLATATRHLTMDRGRLSASGDEAVPSPAPHVAPANDAVTSPMRSHAAGERNEGVSFVPVISPRATG
jgi:branched-chain amino acid transport system ATP-binding protein